MTLFVDLASAETTSDSDEILVSQGSVFRRVTLNKVRPSSLSVNGDSTTLTQTGTEVQALLDQVESEANTRTTFTQLAGATTANGILALSQDWDSFEEIIIEYELTDTGIKSQNVFYTEIVTASDSTTVQEYMLNSHATVSSFNFRDTNRDELHFYNNGDDDSIVSVYGRYLK